MRILELYLDAYRGLPRKVWHLSLVLMLNRTGSMVLVFLPLYLTQVRPFTLAFAGTVLSIYGCGHLVGAILGGWLCDRLGALRIQFWSLVLSGVLYLVLEHLRSKPAIAVAVFLVAVAAEAFRPANMAALAALTPPPLRTRAMALNRMALNLGFALGPAVGGWLAVVDYAWLFRVDGVTCLASGWLLHALFKGRAAPAVSAHDVAEAEAEGGAGRSPFRDAVFLAFLGLMVLFTVDFFQGFSTYPVYLKEIYGLSEARFGLLITLNGLMILAFEMVLTRRVEVYAPLRVVGVGVGICGLSMVLMTLGRSWALAAFSMAVWTVGEMLVAPFAGGWVANRAGVANRGLYMGLHTMAWGVGFILAPVSGTWFYEHVGPDALWLAVGVLGVVNWIGFEGLLRWERREPARARARS